MKTVYELSESEIEEAIRAWVSNHEKKDPKLIARVSLFERGGHMVANVEMAPSKTSTAKTAASILGGSGSALGRAGGLEQGLEDD